METKSYTGKDFYTSYCDYIEDNPLYQVDYKTFRGVINDYFKYLRDELIENGKEIKLPCRLGTLSVIKHKPKEYSGKSLRIDYAESKKLGKMVYHLNEHSNFYKYRFYWKKSDVPLPFKSRYQLIATRHNKRRLAQIVKNREVDYVII